MNQADTAWMLIATALVLLMTPALAFFYGGLVRSKNALNTMMMSFISLGFVGVLWAVIGYSLAFAPGNNWIGDTSRVFLNGVGLAEQGTIPQYLFMCFQGTFAIITAALISGAIVERMRFSAYVVFITMIINVLKVFDLVITLAPGSSQNAASVIALAMWRESFGGVDDFGVGSAIAVLLFALVIPVLALNIRRFRRET